MGPTPIHASARYPRLSYAIVSLATQIPKLVTRFFNGESLFDHNSSHLAKRAEKHNGKFIAFAVLIPVLVLLSGLFAGLTLGYMSLDETQLQVLSISGTPKQKEYANKIKPIRKNGHLLLITLILSNMIVNETLPVISDTVLGGGVQSVVVSTVLIVIFSEIIPQSLCTRYGLAIGANMAWFVRILIYTVGIVSWPVAKLMEIVLGPYHGIMYRRAELKELIAMHSATGELGGDLKNDTVVIVSSALDFQEKIARQAMTPIDKVFMLSIDSKLDYETLQKICDTGHSRVPVYEEIEMPVMTKSQLELSQNGGASGTQELSLGTTQKVKKILGVLLVKQCVLLDARDAIPLRNVTLNPIPCVAQNEPLFRILNKFQEGRSHMAIVSRFSNEKAESVMREVKKGLTQRLKDRVGMGDHSSDEDDSDSDDGTGDGSRHEGNSTASDHEHDDKKSHKRRWGRKGHKKHGDVEMGDMKAGGKAEGNLSALSSKIMSAGREQQISDDAVLPKEGADEILRGLEPAVMPLGIITLEDVVEEIIGEEIYDEFDPEGQSHLPSHITPSAKYALAKRRATTTAAPSKRRGTSGAATPLTPTAPHSNSEPGSPVQSTVRLQGRIKPKTKPKRANTLPTGGKDTPEAEDAKSKDEVAQGEADNSIPSEKEKAGPDKDVSGDAK